uniref:Reverse transcriptase domain-containing protein n=1 Tax=Caenorhabditis japonica TaxID=281687 RepID=A0A8R1I602_CAEJA
MDKMITGLSGVTAYLDDVIIVGRDEKEHNENLFELFQRIAENRTPNDATPTSSNRKTPQFKSVALQEIGLFRNEWSACSPDLNLPRIYVDLKVAIEAERDAITETEIKTLVANMPNRVIEVIQKYDGYTNY